MSAPEATASAKRRLPAKISPSALSRYRTCPKQFLLADIERVGRNGFEASPALAQGNAIHEALKSFFGLDVGYRSADNAERCLRSVWVAQTKGSFQTREEEAVTGGASVEMIRRYASRADLSAEPVARERWVGVRVGGTSLYGKIDRLDRRGDAVAVVDYKTGRRALEPEDLRHEPAVQVYVLGTEATYGLPVEQVRIAYLALEREVVWEVEREDVEALGKSLISTLRAIRDDEVFEA
jgi:putative RecB family exonuclease